MSVNRKSARRRGRPLEVGERGVKQIVTTSLLSSLESSHNQKEQRKIERVTLATLTACDLTEKNSKDVECRSNTEIKPKKQLQKSCSLPRLNLLPTSRKTGNSHLQTGIDSKRRTNMSSSRLEIEESRTRMGLGGAPRRGRLQRGATWHDGLTAATPDHGRSRGYIDWSWLKRSTITSPRSKEHQIVFDELNILGRSSVSDSQDVTKSSGTFSTENKERKSGQFVSKRWCTAKTKIDATSAFKSTVETAKRRPRDFKTTKLKIDDTLLEENETDTDSSNEKSKSEDFSPTKLAPNSRGWIIVKQNLSRIAEMAPKDSIDSMPIQFTNIAQIVRAKQFRMMMRRRASFIDNGVFKFDEAKADLYKRYNRINLDAL